MYAIEFEASIKNGIVQIPKEYQEVYNQEKVQIFIISAEKPSSKKSFNPKEFYGVANISKEEIDEYLQNSRDEWEHRIEK